MNFTPKKFPFILDLIYCKVTHLPAEIEKNKKQAVDICFKPTFHFACYSIKKNKKQAVDIKLFKFIISIDINLKSAFLNSLRLLLFFFCQNKPKKKKKIFF